MSIEYVTYVSSQKIVLCTNKYRVQIVLHIQEYYENNIYKIFYKCHCYTFKKYRGINVLLVCSQVTNVYPFQREVGSPVGVERHGAGVVLGGGAVVGGEDYDSVVQHVTRL